MPSQSPRSKSPKRTSLMDSYSGIFKGVFAGMLGSISAMAAVALFSLIICSIGLSILKKYNEPETKLLENMNSQQYMGCLLIVIGLLPWLEYFFMSIMFNAGGAAFNAIADEM